MSNLNRQEISFANSPSVDAFARARFSEPVTLFDSKQLTSKQPLYWTELATGSGTSTHAPLTASTNMAVTTSAGSVIRQTRQYINYQPGKSQVIIATAVMGTRVSGITKRVGYFDGYNGLFFEDNGTNLGVVIRSSVSGSPVDTRVAQDSWNIDPMDGTGPSGITVDVSKGQIFAIDFEWLGLGRVRWYMFIGGTPYLVHESLHANNVTNVYMSSPNLPVRYEIVNAAGAAAGSTMQHICSTVFSEGGFNPRGLLFTAYTDVASAISAIPRPILSIRKKAITSNFRGTSLNVVRINLACTTNDDIRWRLFYRPTITGGTAASWTDVNTESGMQFDVARTGTIATGSGAILASGFFSDTVSETVTFNTNIGLGYELSSGVPDELVLTASNSVGSANVLSSIDWIEYG